MERSRGVFAVTDVSEVGLVTGVAVHQPYLVAHLATAVTTLITARWRCRSALVDVRCRDLLSSAGRQPCVRRHGRLWPEVAGRRRCTLRLFGHTGVGHVVPGYRGPTLSRVQANFGNVG